MASANDPVIFRRNKQIQEAIDSQNLKQAVNLIEKRVKKGEDTVFLKAWKAQILASHIDDTHHARGIAETLELCKLEPVITDLETLEIIHVTLKSEGDQEEARKLLWERAAKAKPQDHGIQRRWFSYSFEADDWKSAQKAAMSLQSNFPKERKYYFWAIFLCHLISVDGSSPEADRKLFGTLAYRMISKAVDNVPSDPEELLSVPRAIQTSEEMILLIKIFEAQGRHAEIAKILDSESVGLNSRILQNEWTFVGVKLASMEKAGMWVEGLSFAKSLLAIPDDEAGLKALQERDDWAPWVMLAAAAREINTPETTIEVRNFIQEFLHFVPYSRNAQLFRLELIYWGFWSRNLSIEDLFVACKEYLDLNKTRLYCFPDLAKYMTTLDKEHLSKFVDYAFEVQHDGNEANSVFKAVPAIMALKLDYCFRMSADESNVSKQRVADFVARCIQTYREADHPAPNHDSSAIESQPCDDLLLLAAMCLIRFSDLWVDGGQENARDIILIRATCILERLLVDSPHNYHALLMLVRTYLLLGAGSLALATFTKMSVKHMQYESVAHNFFTRLATIHPHSAPPIEGAEYKEFNPQSALAQALHFYHNAEYTTVRNRGNGMDLGSYYNVEGTIGLQKRLKDSVCRRMWALEARRMQRFAGGDSMDRYEDLAKDESPLLDQREFEAFMNCEPTGVPKFEERIRVGPLPKGKWILLARVTEHLFSLIRDIAFQKPNSPDFTLPDPEHFSGPDAESEMTGAEIEALRINTYLLKVAMFMKGSKSVSSEDIDSALAQVIEWLESKLKNLAMDNKDVSKTMSNTAISVRPGTPSAPSWRYLHEMFMTLESAKAAAQIASHASKRGSRPVGLPREPVVRVAALARQVYEGVRANTRALKSRISGSGMLSDLIDLVLAGPGNGEEGKQLNAEMEKMIGMSDLELFSGALMESWEEGLDGVMDVSL